MQDEQLSSLVSEVGESNWNRIAKQISGKSEIKCHKRWLEINQLNHLQKSGWTPEEDGNLQIIVSQLGATNWAQIASLLPGRISKQCRERWINHLDPNLSKRMWTAEEDS